MHLPKPYPDEIIGSIIARACFRYDLPVSRLVKCIFGGTRKTFSFLMASNPRRLALLCGLDPEELVHRHTILPYTVAFMPSAEKLRHRQKALNPVDGDRGLAALTQSVSHGVPFRRICPQCVKGDLAQYGETYWHRAHHLPGVGICVIHGIRLQTSSIRLRGKTQTRDVQLPGQIISSPSSLRVQRKVLDVITRISAAALSGNIDDDKTWFAHYRSATLEKGYQLSGDSVASSKVAEDFMRFYSKSFLRDAGCEIANASHRWPALMVRGATSCGMAATKHVLFQAFLELAPPSDGNFEYEKPGMAVANFAKLDVRTVHGLKALLYREANSGKRYTVSELLEAIGVWQPFRHHRAEFPLTDAFIKDFRMSDQSERQIGRRPYWQKRLGLVSIRTNPTDEANDVKGNAPVVENQ